MAWDWVAPAATGVVGITSVIGTVVAARTSTSAADKSAVRARNYAVEDARREERRTVYLRFLDTMMAVQQSAKDCCEQRRKGIPLQEAGNPVFAKVQELQRVQFEVHLICDEAVAPATRAIVDSALETLRAAAIAVEPSIVLINGTAIGNFVAAAKGELAISPPA